MGETLLSGWAEAWIELQEILEQVHQSSVGYVSKLRLEGILLLILRIRLVESRNVSMRSFIRNESLVAVVEWAETAHDELHLVIRGDRIILVMVR